MIMKLSRCQVPPLRELRPDLPPELAEVVHTALSASPEDRFESAGEMLQNITAILRAHPLPTDARPIGRSVEQARRILASQPPRE